MTVELAPIEGPLAWSAKDMHHPQEWIHTVSSADKAELKSATAALQGRALESLRKADFPLPKLGLKLVRLRDDVLQGRGFAVLRGLDVTDAPLAEIALMFWGIGTWLGEAISQNQDGQLLGHVTDIGARADHPLQRGFQSADSLPFHTDTASDLIALLCLRGAKTGGLSSVASAATLYNEMLARHPYLLQHLLRPVHGTAEVRYQPASCRGMSYRSSAIIRAASSSLSCTASLCQHLSCTACLTLIRYSARLSKPSLVWLPNRPCMCLWIFNPETSSWSTTWLFYITVRLTPTTRHPPPRGICCVYG
jgi:hypothetical protein